MRHATRTLPIPLLLLGLATLLFASVPVQAAGPLAARAQHRGSKHSGRCKRGKATVKVGRHRSCRRLAPKAGVAGARQRPAALLKGALAAISGARFQGKRARAASRAVRNLSRSRGLRDLALLTRRTKLPFQARPLAALARPDQIELPGGWTAKVRTAPDHESTTLEVSKGKDHAELTMRISEPALEHCPDAAGAVPVTSGFTFALDAVADAGLHDGSVAFIHYAQTERGKSEGHTSDDAHLHDFDFQAKAYEHIQGGLKNKQGKVLITNPPTLATVQAASHHVTPFKNIEALEAAYDHDDKEAAKRALDGLAKDWMGPEDFYNITDAAWDAHGIQAIGTPLGLVIGDLLETHKVLIREQNAHWLKDCLQLSAQTPNQTLAAGSTAPLLVTIAPRQGSKVAPATLTATTDVGTAAPATAKGGADPTRFSYTAPASAWKHGTVTVRAASKQGVGTTTLEFEAPQDTYSLRWSVAIDQRFLGGSSGTGSASWRGSAQTLLLGDVSSADPLQGAVAAPFGWSSFSYEDDGEPMVCQAGGLGHVDVTGTGSSPGSFEVPAVWLVEGEPTNVQATIRFAAPVDHFTNTFYPDATSCGEFTTSSSWATFDGYRALLGQQPGVKTHYPPGGGANLAGQTYEIDGWHPGTGDVFATRELAWTDGDGGGEPATAHIRLDLIRQPSS